MKLRLKDKVVVISGKDKGKKGEIISIFPKKNQVIVSNVGQVKKHLKPSSKHPKGGIITVNKPIDASKVMVIDPATSRP